MWAYLTTSPSLWLLLAVLALAFVFKSQAETRLAIIYFAIINVSTGMLFWEFGYPSFKATCLILWLASFLQLTLYMSLNITIGIFLAGLCEVFLMLLYMGSWAEIEPVRAVWYASAKSINALALLALAWNWLNGMLIGNRVLYPRLFSINYHGLKNWANHLQIFTKIPK